MGKKHDELIRTVFFQMTLEKIKSLQSKGHAGEVLEVEFRHFVEEMLYIAYKDLGLTKFSEMSSEDSSDDDSSDTGALTLEEEKGKWEGEETLKIGTLWIPQEEAVKMITDGVPIPPDRDEDNLMKHLIHHLNGFLNKRYFTSRLDYSEDKALVTYDNQQICTVNILDGCIQMMDAPNVEPTIVTAQVFPAIVTFLYPEGMIESDKKDQSKKPNFDII